MIKLVKHSFHNEADTKRRLIDFIVKADTLSMGEETRTFEQLFAKKQGRSFAVFVNSGSSANFILLQALLNIGRLKRGDRIGFSALTWSTNVMPIIQLGMVPVAIDCELDTLNVSSKILQTRIKDLNAFFLTNVLGLASDIGNIRTLCEEGGVIFLEDNCESLGSMIDGKLLGNFGVASTFSFFVGHHISTIEGGMVCTDDEELYNMLLIARAHGWSRNLSPQKQKELQDKYKIDDFYARYTFYDVGNNMRPTDIQGFIGTTQLDYWNSIVKKREENFNFLNKSILANGNIQVLRTKHMDIFSNFAVPIVCITDKIFKMYKKRFEDNDVETRPIIAGNITRQPFYKKYVHKEEKLENTDFINQHGFYFGNNPDLTEKELVFLSHLLVA